MIPEADKQAQAHSCRNELRVPGCIRVDVNVLVRLHEDPATLQFSPRIRLEESGRLIRPIC